MALARLRPYDDFVGFTHRESSRSFRRLTWARPLLRCLALVALLALPASDAQAGNSPFGKHLRFSHIATDGRKLVAAGSTSSCAPESQTCEPRDNNLVVARFKPSGEVDRSLGKRGSVVLPAQNYPVSLGGLAVTDDGSIAVGYTPEPGDSVGLVVTRLTDAGKRDPTFGSGGSISIPSSVFRASAGPHGMVALPGGRLVIAGASGAEAGNEFSYLALGPDGAPDVAYGPGGVRSVNFGAGTVGGRNDALAVLPDGSVAGLGSVQLDDGSSGLAAAAVRKDGSAEPGFGAGGTTVLPPGPVNGDFGVAARSIALVPGRGFLLAPVYFGPGPGPCESVLLRSLTVTGTYPGSMFATGADSLAFPCTSLADAQPTASDRVLAVGTRLDLRPGAGEQPEAVAALYGANSPGEGLGSPRAHAIGPSSAPSYAAAQVGTFNGKTVVAGAVVADQCGLRTCRSRSVAALFGLGADGRRDRSFGDRGVALFSGG
jgi:uncharacterized delta-60 repeat protein